MSNACAKQDGVTTHTVTRGVLNLASVRRKCLWNPALLQWQSKRGHHNMHMPTRMRPAFVNGTWPRSPLILLQPARAFAENAGSMTENVLIIHASKLEPLRAFYIVRALNQSGAK